MSPSDPHPGWSLAVVSPFAVSAQEVARRVAASELFELAAPAPLNLVCFRPRHGDAFGERLLERLNASGELYLTHTRLDGRFTLRFMVGQSQTEARHVERAWQRIEAEAAALAAELAAGEGAPR